MELVEGLFTDANGILLHRGSHVTHANDGIDVRTNIRRLNEKNNAAEEEQTNENRSGKHSIENEIEMGLILSRDE